jgi:hypothetical protein
MSNIYSYHKKSGLIGLINNFFIYYRYNQYNLDQVHLEMNVSSYFDGLINFDAL